MRLPQVSDEEAWDHAASDGQRRDSHSESSSRIIGSLAFHPRDLEGFSCNPLGQQSHPLQVCPCLPLVQWFLEWRFLALYPSDYPFMVNSGLSMLFIHGAHWTECFETVWVL